MSVEEIIASALIGGSIAGFCYFICYCEKVFYKVKEEFRCFYIWNNHPSLTLSGKVTPTDYTDLNAAVAKATVRDNSRISSCINFPTSNSKLSWHVLYPVGEDEKNDIAR
jgi:hypothetical protein